MRRNTAIVTALVVVGAGAAAAVLAEEKSEDIVAPETGELRPPEGEWIPSVPGAPPGSGRWATRIRRSPTRRRS